MGHFHLYFWCRNAVEDYCIINPEFPTGNGRVDLHLKCDGKAGIIEVKIYTNQARHQRTIQQAAGYAQKLGLSAISVALFAPVEEEEEESVLAKLSGEHDVDGVRVVVSAIGWT